MGNKCRTLLGILLIGVCVLNYYYPLLFSCVVLVIGLFFLFVDWLLEVGYNEVSRMKVGDADNNDKH